MGRNVLLSRPPLERMLRIHRAISSGALPNASKLARELEVSAKSIQRDLEFMRDRLNLPLEYDAARHGYYYTEKVASFPALEITEGEFFSLVVAEKALQQYRGTPFEKPLLSAFRKMAASLPDTVTLNLEEFDHAIAFRTTAEPIVALPVFDLLAKATAQRQQISLVYRKPGKSETESRTVDPYQLANINGEWFLFGYDHLRSEVRTFVPSRIVSATRTGRTFLRPRKFSLQKTLKGSFGVVSGKGEYDVAIHFSEWVADYIREKKWHGSQELIELPDGRLELRLKLSSLSEIKRWILGWAGQAVPVAPAELVDAVKQAAREILERCGKREPNIPES